MTHEMRSLAVRECGEALREHALAELLSKSTATKNFIRMWLSANHPAEYRTPLPEIEQAVRAYLGDAEWEPYKRPAVRSLEFGSPIK